MERSLAAKTHRQATGPRPAAPTAPRPAPEPAPGVPLFLRRAPLSMAEPAADSAGALATAFGAPLRIGGLDDPEERQAERVSSAVLRAPAAIARVTPTATSGAATLRRAPATVAASAAPPASLPGSGPGSPLSSHTRARLEPGLGADLSGVRVHSDVHAGDAARSVNARAFTVGSDIWLGHGESQENLGLMAHEATHVLQHDGVVRRAPAAGAPSAPSAPPAPKKKKKREEEKPAAGAPSAPPGAAGAAPAPDSAAATPAPAPAAPAAAVELLMPEPPAELSAEESARLRRVEKRAGEAAAVQSDLPPAEEQVGDARDAVEIPAAEREALAQETVVTALADREPPSPEIEALCDKIRELIRSKRPPDEDSLTDADPKAMGAAAGGELNSSVEGDTGKVQGSYDAIQSTPPPEAARPADPLAPEPAAGSTPDPNASSATPDAVPAEDLSLDADVESTQKKMDDAGMSTEPALLVKSGPIAEARGAQGELGEMAQRDPAEVLAELEGNRATATADMAALQASALAALEAARAQTVGKVGGQKTGMTETEAQTRERIGAEARGIYESAQKQVDALLQPLVPTAMKRWESGIAVVSEHFERSLKTVADWIEERHSGIGGAILGGLDYISGLPDWVTEDYDRAETVFGDEVCALIREISSEVNGVIATCEALIADARTDIATLFDDLPTELQGWAAEEQEKLGKQLDGLSGRAQATKQSFTKDLVERASQTVQSARERIHSLRQAAGGLIGRVLDAIGRFLDDPIKFIINALLDLVGIPQASFWSMVDRIGEVIGDIADDPLGFANNMMEAIGQGFDQFFDNIPTHLLHGFIDWLTGGLASIGVHMPKDLSAKSLITFFLEIMGITWARIRKLLVKHIGEKNVGLIEKAWALVSLLIEKGPEGIFEMIKEKLDPQTIIDAVISAAIDYLVDAVIKQVSIRIVLLFNPAGAIFQALEAIYRVLKWVFQNAARIFQLVETVVNGMAQVLAGNIGGMANAVEKALAALIPPVIDFLADYLGLGDLPDKIRETIVEFQTEVEKTLDELIGWLVEKAKGLLGLGGKKDAEGGELGKSVSFSGGGESHTLSVKVSGADATLMVSSAPQNVITFLDRKEIKAYAKTDEGGPKVSRAKELASSAELDADKLAAAMAAAAKSESEAPGPEQDVETQDDALESEEEELARLLGEIMEGTGLKLAPIEESFDMDGEGHQIFVEFRDGRLMVEMASRRRILRDLVGAALHEAEKPPVSRKKRELAGDLTGVMGEVTSLLEFERALQTGSSEMSADEMRARTNLCVVELRRIGTVYGVKGLEKLGTVSVHVEHGMIRPSERGDAFRGVFYGGWDATANSHADAELTQLKTEARDPKWSGFEHYGDLRAFVVRDRKGGWTPYLDLDVPYNVHLDHLTEITPHWRSSGHDQVQSDRTTWNNDPSNLQVINQKENLRKSGPRMSPSDYEVGLNFLGPED